MAEVDILVDMCLIEIDQVMVLIACAVQDLVAWIPPEGSLFNGLGDSADFE